MPASPRSEFSTATPATAGRLAERGEKNGSSFSANDAHDFGSPRPFADAFSVHGIHATPIVTELSLGGTRRLHRKTPSAVLTHEAYRFRSGTNSNFRLDMRAEGAIAYRAAWIRIVAVLAAIMTSSSSVRFLGKMVSAVMAADLNSSGWGTQYERRKFWMLKRVAGAAQDDNVGPLHCKFRVRCEMLNVMTLKIGRRATSTAVRCSAHYSRQERAYAAVAGTFFASAPVRMKGSALGNSNSLRRACPRTVLPIFECARGKAHDRSAHRARHFCFRQSGAPLDPARFSAALARTISLAGPRHAMLAAAFANERNYGTNTHRAARVAE